MSSLARSASVVSSATLLSRVLGFLRDMFLASLFPAARLEPFIIAFRIPNALRRFVAEGAFSISVVPVYSKIADPDYQKSVYRSLVTILTFVLAAAAILGWVFSSQLITLYAPGFRDSTAFDQAVQMLRIMFPYLVCLSYVALFMGVLNSHQHFFAPAIAPVILNLCMLAAMFWQARHGGGSLTVIAWAVLVSGLLQWVLQIPYLGKFDRMPALSKPIIYPELRRIFSLWLPAMWSVSIVQISTLIGTRFASLLPEGTLTGMYLAERIIELPLGGFAVAIGQAALPVLSKQIKESPKDFDETIVHAMLLSSLFALPAAVGIFILADPMVHVLYFRRAFAAETASITVDCLRMMAISLPFGAQLRTFASAYHSHERMRLPALFSTLALGAYVLVSSTTYREWRHVGLTLGSSLSVGLNTLMLITYFHFFIRKLAWRAMLPSLLKIIFSTALMAIALHLTLPHLWPLFQGTTFVKWATLLSTCAAGAVFFWTMVWLLKVPEAEPFFERLRRKILRQPS